MIPETIEALREEVRGHMSEKRYLHTLGVEKEMRCLAAALDPSLLEDAVIAALLHDVTKCFTKEEQLSYCRENGIEIDDDERLAPALLHAKTGAHYAKNAFPHLVTDAVADAILRHTTAHPPLSLLAAMLFVADFTEEGRDYPDCIALRDRLHTSELHGENALAHFQTVLLAAMDISLLELLREGRPIALRSVEARNAVLSGAILF